MVLGKYSSDGFLYDFVRFSCYQLGHGGLFEFVDSSGVVIIVFLVTFLIR